MGLDQWLLVTLTCGVGGSLLSIGSAAGVAVMGINRENYTFMSHLKWAPVIFYGLYRKYSYLVDSDNGSTVSFWIHQK